MKLIDRTSGEGPLAAEERRRRIIISVFLSPEIPAATRCGAASPLIMNFIVDPEKVGPAFTITRDFLLRLNYCDALHLRFDNLSSLI